MTNIMQISVLSKSWIVFFNFAEEMCLFSEDLSRNMQIQSEDNEKRIF